MHGDIRNKTTLSLEDNLELSQSKADLGNQFPGQNIDSGLLSHPVSIPMLPGISEHIPSTRNTNYQNQGPAK